MRLRCLGALADIIRVQYYDETQLQHTYIDEDSFYWRHTYDHTKNSLTVRSIFQQYPSVLTCTSPRLIYARPDVRKGITPTTT